LVANAFIIVYSALILIRELIISHKDPAYAAFLVFTSMGVLKYLYY